MALSKLINSISGTISNADDTVFSGITVKAFSKIFLAENLLGTAVTNGQGFYTINYSNTGLILPDVFIRIYQADGKILLGQSPVVRMTSSSLTLNFKLQVEQNNSVNGTIYDINDVPKPYAFVELYEKELRINNLLGTSIADENGYYEITYAASKTPLQDSTDVCIKVYETDAATHTQKGDLLGESPVEYSVLSQYTLNYRIGGEAHKDISEFNALQSAITPHLNGINPKDLQPDDITVLAGKTGADSGKIATLPVAYQLSEQTDPDPAKQIAPDIFNGLLALNFPQDLNSLLRTKSSSIRNGIQQAINSNVISFKPQQQIDDTINTLNAKATEYVLKGTDAQNVSFQNMIKAVLPSDNLQTAFVQTWFAHEDEPEKFWDALGTQTGFDSTTVENVKNIFGLNQLTGSETGLTVLLYGESQADNDLKDLTGFAKFTKDDWKTRIAQVVNGSSFTEFPGWVTGETQDEKIESYASYFEDLIKSLFPTRVFAKRFASDSITNFGGKTDLVTFLTNNPDFDLQTNQPGTLFEAANLGGIQDKDTLKKNFLAINRLSKLSATYEHISNLNNDGLDSANAIVKKYSLSKFIEKFSAGLGEETAASIYKKAKQVDNRTTAVATAIKTRNDIPVYVIDGNPDGTYNTSPDYESMFGDNMLCNCDECESVYGAAAYLVDILKYFDDNSNEAFHALTVNRRSDLIQIFLTCQNTNTPLPYIDLVNEILEDAVAGTSSAYQTTNTAEELAAYPEHTNDAAYTILETANSSFNLPFNAPLLSTRLMLDKLGTHRYELMELFYGKKGDSKYTDINIAAEYLQLSPQELAILNGADTTIAEIAMDKVNDFLQQTGLTYIEMLQLLESYFINQQVDPEVILEDGTLKRAITIVSSDITHPENCDINTLIFNGGESAAPKLNRYIRLWKKLGWDILDLDKAFTAFGITGAMTVDKIDNSLIIFLSHVARMKASFGLSVPVIITIWSDIDTEIYIDHTTEGQPLMMSLYQKLFQNKQVTNPVDSNFKLPFNQQNPLSLSGNAKTIIAALNISQADFDTLKGFTDDTLTENNLSILFRYSTLAKALRITISDLISLINIIGINPFGDTSATEQTLVFLDKVSVIRSSGYFVNDLSVLLGKTTIATEVPNVKMISDLFITLREGLKKISILFPDAADNADQASLKLQNQNSFISDTLSTTFKTESKLVAVLLNNVTKSTADNTKPAITPFIDEAFINSDVPIFSINELNEITWTFPDLFNTYISINNAWNRISGLMAKFKITTDEFIYLQAEQDSLNITGIWNLQDGSANNLYNSFENLYNIIRFRNSLTNLTADWYTLFDGAKNNNKTNFLTAFINLTEIDKLTVIDLTGKEQLTAAFLSDINVDTDVTDKGILNYTFPDDYKNGAALLNIIRCVSLAVNFGCSIDDLSQFTNAGTDDNDAELAKSILKSKYDETTWLDVIKPISNQLRILKRDVLVSYLIDEPDRYWYNTNDLYAYFLIDVEMDACMITSRIKQAISSVQLFVDRCLLNLEKDVSGNPIILAEGFSGQWNTWRKQYRVWEANRQIFLYPENWIQPELRDDKTPFFEDLESALKQNDITDDTARDAVLAYLEKLDTVANLEMVGLFPDEVTGIVHVIGRTRNIPHQYFYRKQINNVWSAWEKMDVDIEGDHILPVVWNNRLMVFWGVFTEKQFEGGGTTTISNPSKDGDLTMHSTPADTYLQIKLAWSEYKNGKWSGKKISEAATASNSAISNILDLKKENIFLSSLIDNSTLSIKLWWDVGIFGSTNTDFISDISSTTFQIITNNRPPTIDNIQNEDVQYISIIPNTYINSIFLANKENSTPQQLVIFKEGLYIKSTTIFDSYSLFSKPSIFQLLPNHHEISNTTTETHFFFSDASDIFYMHSFERIVIPQSNIPPVNSNTALSRSDPPILDIKINSRDNNSFNYDQNRTSKTLIANKYTKAISSSDIGTSIQFEKFYNFQTFYHPYSNDFIKIINSFGIDGLFKLRNNNNDSFHHDGIQNINPVQIITEDAYSPSSRVITYNSYKEVDFKLQGSYSIYNWELFFHIPLLIATQLSQNQKFEEARKWFHYIFDPTESSSSDTGAKRFWRTQPFKKEIDNGILTIDQLITNEEYSQGLSSQLSNWEQNPFNPHAVARLRVSAYMRCTLMKYIDNLIAWGDNLFQRDTIESINEANLLYVVAANLLGEKPQQMPPRNIPIQSSYNDIEGRLDSFGDAKVAIESLISVVDSNNESSDNQLLMPIFCIPKNDILLGYWDTVADRLFKIRHCMNIEGVVQQLPLFEPPIDPALLVRATAAGLDLNTILNNMNATLPNYRFQIMLQKANELCSDVKGLGSELLSALEKQDAEKLALIRSGHEISMLEAVRDIKVSQRDEAKENLNSLNAMRRVTEERMNYYSSREFMNAWEITSFASSYLGIGLQASSSEAKALSATLHITPDTKVGSGFTIGFTAGGSTMGAGADAAAEALQGLGIMNSAIGMIASTMGNYKRRQDEWTFQAKSATLELNQIDKQILAAEIRLAIAEKDLENHDLQIEQSKEVDDYMRSKFTNQQLYDWMIGQVSSVYFQSYQLAYSTAKKAEKCMQYELGVENGSYIQFGYWDSLKKGLLSGEKLQYDLRRLENAYLEQNKRELEITKHISVALINPVQLLQLKETGTCIINLPEELFDLDFPGHYFRRIKSVSISIPCIAGPYSSVNATLKLSKNEHRISKSETTKDDYKKTIDEINAPGSGRFRTVANNTTSIATSNAQMDSGMFELNFRDERYLPFEGAGTASTWSLELMKEAALRQFNYDTISDVIFHVRYTAREGESSGAIENLKQVIEDAATSGMPLSIAFDMKHDFADEWHQFINNNTVGDTSSLVLDISKDMLPFFAANQNVEVSALAIYARKKDTTDRNAISFNSGQTLVFDEGNPDSVNLFKTTLSGLSADITDANDFTYSIQMDKTTIASIDNMFIVVLYKLSQE